MLRLQIMGYKLDEKYYIIFQKRYYSSKMTKVNMILLCSPLKKWTERLFT